MSDLDLLTSSYDYELPPSLIATHPVMPKSSARLLVYDRRTDSVVHTCFGELCSVLPECDVVFNNTKVIKARIYGHKSSGAKCELLLHRALADGKCIVQIKARVKQNDTLIFDAGVSAKVLELRADGTRLVEFYKDNKILSTSEIYELLEHIGHIPLPPYIKRADNSSDADDYQSIFARHLGAVAAPTASLHFSQQMIDELSTSHAIHQITLHVGAGTFRGVECENITSHNMHSEIYDIPQSVCDLISSSRKILAVGTTSARSIEYYARTKKPSGECDLFLHPKNTPLRLDYLLTNFHLPRSTLIMLVASFIGRQKTLEIYNEAIKLGYRFYSYGDGMLIL